MFASPLLEMGYITIIDLFLFTFTGQNTNLQVFWAMFRVFQISQSPFRKPPYPSREVPFLSREAKSRLFLVSFQTFNYQLQAKGTERHTVEVDTHHLESLVHVFRENDVHSYRVLFL